MTTLAVMAAVLAAACAALATCSLAVRERPLVAAPGRAGDAPRRGASIVAAVGGSTTVRRFVDPARTMVRLSAAGSARSVADVAGAKVCLAAGACALLLFAPAPAPLLAPIAALAGFRAPDIALTRRAKARRARAERELPVFLDLLAIATSAGLAPQLAVRRATGAIEGPLAEELSSAVRAVDLGGRWRDELHAAAERVDSADLHRTVATVTRAETLGSSLAPEVARLAADVREARRSAMTERARAAPVKMLFPLVFLVLPAFLLLTVVPVLVTTVRSI